MRRLKLALARDVLFSRKRMKNTTKDRNQSAKDSILILDILAKLSRVLNSWLVCFEVSRRCGSAQFGQCRPPSTCTSLGPLLRPTGQVPPHGMAGMQAKTLWWMCSLSLLSRNHNTHNNHSAPHLTVTTTQHLLAHPTTITIKTHCKP